MSTEGSATVEKPILGDSHPEVSSGFEPELDEQHSKIMQTVDEVAQGADKSGEAPPQLDAENQQGEASRVVNVPEDEVHSPDAATKSEKQPSRDKNEAEATGNGQEERDSANDSPTIISDGSVEKASKGSSLSTATKLAAPAKSPVAKVPIKPLPRPTGAPPSEKAASAPKYCPIAPKVAVPPKTSPVVATAVTLSTTSTVEATPSEPPPTLTTLVPVAITPIAMPTRRDDGYSVAVESAREDAQALGASANEPAGQPTEPPTEAAPTTTPIAPTSDIISETPEATKSTTGPKTSSATKEEQKDAATAPPKDAAVAAKPKRKSAPRKKPEPKVNNAVKPASQPQEQQRIMLPTGIPQLQMIFSNQQPFGNGNIFMSPNNYLQFVNRNPGQQFIPIMPAGNIASSSQAQHQPSTSNVGSTITIANTLRREGTCDATKKDSPSKSNASSKNLPKPVAVSTTTGQLTQANMIPMQTQFLTMMPNGTLMMPNGFPHMMANIMQAQQSRSATSTHLQILPAYIQPKQAMPSMSMTSTTPSMGPATSNKSGQGKTSAPHGCIPTSITISANAPIASTSSVSMNAVRTPSANASSGLPAPIPRMVQLGPNGPMATLRPHCSATMSLLPANATTFSMANLQQPTFMNLAAGTLSTGRLGGIFPQQVVQASASASSAASAGRPLGVPVANGQIAGTSTMPTSSSVNGAPKRKRKEGVDSASAGPSNATSSGTLPSLTNEGAQLPPLLSAQTEAVDKPNVAEDEENEPPPVLARDEPATQTIDRIFTKEAELMHRQLNDMADKDGRKRQSIKHFIDGMLIEEDVAPFPIEHSALLNELKAVEKDIKKEEEKPKKSVKKQAPKKDKPDTKKAETTDKAEPAKKTTKVQPKKASTTAKPADDDKKASKKTKASAPTAAATESPEKEPSRPGSTVGRKRPRLKEVASLLTMDFGPGRTPFPTTSPERYEKEVREEAEHYKALIAQDDDKPSRRSRDSPASMVSSSSVGKRPSSSSSSRTGRPSNDAGPSPRKVAKKTSRTSDDAPRGSVLSPTKTFAKAQEGSPDEISEEEIRQWGNDTCNWCHRMFRELRMRMRECPQYCSKDCKKQYKRYKKEKLRKLGNEQENRMRQQAVASCSATPSSSTGSEKRDSTSGGQRMSSGSSMELSSPQTGRPSSTSSQQHTHTGSSEDLHMLGKKPRPSLSPVFRSPPDPSLNACRSPPIKMKFIRSPTTEHSPPLMRAEGRLSTGGAEEYEQPDARMDYPPAYGYPQPMEAPGASPRYMYSRPSIGSPQRQGPPPMSGFNGSSSSIFQVQSSSNRSTPTAAISSFSESPPSQQGLGQPSRPSSTSQQRGPPYPSSIGQEQLDELNRLYSVHPKHWTSSDVALWVSIIATPEWGPKFEDEDIDGEALLQLDKIHIQSVVPKLGPRLKIEKAQESLKAYYPIE